MSGDGTEPSRAPFDAVVVVRRRQRRHVPFGSTRPNSLRLYVCPAPSKAQPWPGAHELVARRRSPRRDRGRGAGRTAARCRAGRSRPRHTTNSSPVDLDRGTTVPVRDSRSRGTLH